MERLTKIQNKLSESQIDVHKSLKNKIVNVLVENFTDDKTKLFGRSEYMTSVVFNGKKDDIGKIVPVKILQNNLPKHQNSLGQTDCLYRDAR